MAERSKIKVEVERKLVVIAPARQRYELEKLLKNATPKAMHEAFDWGPERGREIVDE